MGERDDKKFMRLATQVSADELRYVEWCGGELLSKVRLHALRIGLSSEEAETAARMVGSAAVKHMSTIVRIAKQKRAVARH